MNTKLNRRKIVFGILDAVLGIVLADLLFVNTWLGLTIIVVLSLRVALSVSWGIPWLSGKVDWSKRQPTPKTQAEELFDDK